MNVPGDPNDMQKELELVEEVIASIAAAENEGFAVSSDDLTALEERAEALRKKIKKLLRRRRIGF